MDTYNNNIVKTRGPRERSRLLDAQNTWLSSRSQQCGLNDSNCLKTIYIRRFYMLRSEHENLVPFVPSKDSVFWHQDKSRCQFQDAKWPVDFLVYAVGGEGYPSGLQIDESGEEAMRFDIVVNSTTYPVALILGGPHPAIWNVGWTDGTNILAVVLSGGHRQAVSGLPVRIPILVSTRDNHGPCGANYITQKSHIPSHVASMSRQLFNRPVFRSYIAHRGRIVVGDGMLAGSRLLTSTDLAPGSFSEPEWPRAGDAGIHDALADGNLRIASLNDAETWANMLPDRNARAGLHDSVLRGGVKIPLGPYGKDVYVVQKPFRVPVGISGLTLYVMKGVPFPDGPVQGVKIYDFNTMKVTFPSR